MYQNDTNAQNAVANGFAPLTAPASAAIADALLVGVKAMIAVGASIAGGFARLRATGGDADAKPLAPHAAIVMVPSSFILDR